MALACPKSASLAVRPSYSTFLDDRSRWTIGGLKYPTGEAWGEMQVTSTIEPSSEEAGTPCVTLGAHTQRANHTYFSLGYLSYGHCAAQRSDRTCLHLCPCKYASPRPMSLLRSRTSASSRRTFLVSRISYMLDGINLVLIRRRVCLS